MLKEYVECSVCGKKIYLGENVLTKPFYVGIYCSPNCYAQDKDIGCCITPLTEELAVRKEVSVKMETEIGVETDTKCGVSKTKELNDLLYVIRTNMTSITRYVRHERKEHPNLTEGQFLDQHLKYKAFADVAVKNILEYVNETAERR